MKLTSIAFASLAALAVATLGIEPVKAGYMNCNSYGGSTSCYGSNGSSYNGYSYGGSTSFYGTDSDGNYRSGSCYSYGGSTSCSSY